MQAKQNAAETISKMPLYLDFSFVGYTGFLSCGCLFAPGAEAGRLLFPLAAQVRPLGHLVQGL